MTTRAWIGTGLTLLLTGGCYLGADGDPHLTGGGTDGVDSVGEGPGSGASDSEDSAGTDGESDGETDGDTEDEPPPSAADADSLFPRLSHQQWENSVRDLLGLSEITGFSENFVADPLSGAFDNQGSTFDVADTLWGDYQRAAESVADMVISDQAIFDHIAPPDVGQDTEARATEFIENFGLQVFRRPVTASERDTLVAAFMGAAGNYPDLDAFDAGMHLSVQTMLQSPYFLYRVVDGEADGNGRVNLDGYERASRLSYALWNTMPDPDLFAAAGAGELDTKEGVVAEAQRMLDDNRARGMVDDLHRQLLKMNLYYDKYRDPDFYPEFDPAVASSMETEAQMFIKDVILDRNEGYAEMLTDTRTFVNAELASYYNLDGSYGPEFEEVTLDATRRSGLLTRLGFLMSRSYQVDPDPIHRGAFISFELLCNDTPAVPDDVTAVEADPTKTNRERVDDHTGAGTCGAGCHPALINPVGFAFENYDAVGSWRDIDNGQPVNAAASFAFDGELHEFANAVELSQQLADSPQAHECYSRHLLEYLHARRHREGDEAKLAELGMRSANGEVSIREVIAELVTQDDFLSLRLAVEGE